ncbi:fibrous sheath-interacting protein 1-like [Physella acuta]|uniref:fibrous sheath-interacting protein 1-like n=1 Tax=Physella acuta TaxID=109671 RepID=UPI0027DAED79|nr:fibrous sheath-interacting protein 1-like [Physella acuta]XP_059146194.1 fibrous sheath-interacting protein 1-like [Physella acuta]XP_059146195.1 fibrous sheath-interacting protein 1-like [Physella acuta]XP_059146196.1 fibrous sheath-interacting protein 1-like [Physella acuta]
MTISMAKESKKTKSILLNAEELQAMITSKQQAGDMDDFELDDDDDDEDDDGEDFNDEDCYDVDNTELNELELKDLNEETLSFLNAVIYKRESGDKNLDPSPKQKEENRNNSLIPSGAEAKTEDFEIDSDEEKSMLKEIRDEINNKVRVEMKSELEEFRDRMKAMESGQYLKQVDATKESEDILETDESRDPRLKEAIIKMNKLDALLKKKIKREKEVKRDRIMFERRMRQEIAELEKEGSNYGEIKVNTDKFLSLELPPSHSEGIIVDEEDSDIPPVFQTQIDDSHVAKSKEKKQTTSKATLGESAGDESRSTSVNSDMGKSSSSRMHNSRLGQRGSKTKDFIKRNKELAANAGHVIALTDDEKKRLEELLLGVDEMPELENAAGSAELDVNQFQLSVHPGEGFCPDAMEKTCLSSIHERLREIIPEEDYKAIMNSSKTSDSSPPQALFTRVGLNSAGQIPEHFGERILFETKEERELNARLQSIEKELEKYKGPQDTEDDEERHLTDEQLDRLLDECCRNMSRTSFLESPDVTPRAQLSSRQLVMENPPRLSEEQLQQLLSEAHFPLSSTLLALREDDEKLLEETGIEESIRAETWKAIKDAKIGEEDAELTDLPTSEDASSIFNTLEDSTYKDVASPPGNKNMSANNASGIDQSYSPGLFENDSLHSSIDFASSPILSSTEQQNKILKKSRSASHDKNHFEIFPKISKPWVDSFDEHSRDGELSPMLVDTSEAAASVRLPHLSSSSFLIHAQQGLNNEETGDYLPSRQPLQIVRNNLTKYGGTSITEEQKGESIQRSSSSLTLQSCKSFSFSDESQSCSRSSTPSHKSSKEISINLIPKPPSRANTPKS